MALLCQKIVEITIWNKNSEQIGSTTPGDIICFRNVQSSVYLNKIGFNFQSSSFIVHNIASEYKKFEELELMYKSTSLESLKSLSCFHSYQVIDLNSISNLIQESQRGFQREGSTSKVSGWIHGTIISIGNLPYYLACSECRKKVQEVDRRSSKEYYCSRCDLVDKQPIRRTMLYLKVADHSGYMKVNTFDSEVVKNIFNVKDEQIFFEKISKIENSQERGFFLDEICQNRSFNMYVKVTWDNYNDEIKPRYHVSNAFCINQDPKITSKSLLKLAKRMLHAPHS